MTKLASTYLPQVGYWNENTGIMEDGSLFAMLHVTGFASDLASAVSLTNMRNAINIAIMSASAPNVEIWHHFVRAEDQQPTTLEPCHTWFGKRLDAAYRNCLADSLFRNDLFLTIVLKPDFSPITDIKKFLSGAKKSPANLPSAEENFEQDFEETVARFMGQLMGFGVRRLGVRVEENGIEFQEIAEALYYIMHGYSRKIGLTAGAARMGRQIMTSLPEFGHNAYALRSALGERYGSILSFFDYPKTVSPILFDSLLRAPFGFSMTNSFCCVQRSQALDRLELLQKKRQSSKDKATGATADLNREMNELADREFVRGSHHFALSVRGKDMDDLDRNVGRAVTLLGGLGITVERENEALKAAFYAQFPGNARYRPRPAGINSRNFASFASLHNVPYGRPKSRWGGPAVMLRSSADTEYAMHMQAQGPNARPGEDVANMMVFGGVGSGKTTLMALLISSLDRLNVQRVVIDKDKGLAPCVEANGGEYLVLPSGEDTGVAPLRMAEDTPEWRSHLQNLVVDLIRSGGDYQLSPDEDQRLQRAIDLQVRLPPSERCLGGIQAMLGQRETHGAAARLRRWCRGERLGWAFDGEFDRIKTDNLLTGFDTTALLKETEVASPLLRHIFFRTNLRADGSPMMFMIDEFWKAGSVDVFQDFTQDQSKTGRKREIAMMLATQSPRDAVASPIGYTLKEQYPTKVFFGDAEASFMDLCGDDEKNPHIPHLGLTLAEYRSVTSVLPHMRHGFLMKRPGASVIVRNDMRHALEQVAVLSGRDATYELMRELQAKYGRAPEQWVPHFERIAPGLASAPKTKERKAA
ncbi:hypothetical protein [Gluconobacter cerinus]|uniref:VirB4 family type IV secretion/conjugal transfer ATPase n=1 Tax=Gluconobacter cerinus TaxID=38307 RepID=UPI001B8D28D1|nr:hypothetical protein [Gluconobacter cerinus]MBS0984273.1 hypothetical protein [Gluconobacter cerinus]